MANTPQTAPHHWTATESVIALKSRRIGALELLDHMIARQERLDGEVNAVVETRAEAARVVARAIDAGTTAPGALAGLPMTIKEAFEIEDFHTTCGMPDLADHVSTRDADAVARLRAAGAVIWGKTNVPLATADHQTYNPIYGVTRNPWNTRRTVGGSSGGAAASLAAGFSALELGSDIGGSIRLPAHFCGVWGHKPTFGTVSGRGHVPPMPGTLSMQRLSVFGPMGRSADDLELGLDLLLGGQYGRDWNLTLPASRHQNLSDFRIAVWTGGFPVDPAYADAIRTTGDALAREGAEVTHLTKAPPPMVDCEKLYMPLLFSVIGAGLPQAELDAYTAAAASHASGSLPDIIARATRSSLARYTAMAEQQEQLKAAWEDWFRDFDVLLCPVSMTTAFEHQNEDGHGPVPQMSRSLDVGGEARPYLENLFWPGVATVAHLPSTVRPLPDQVRDMPAGVQIIGPAFGDRTTLRLASCCDAAFGGFVAPPAFT